MNVKTINGMQFAELNPAQEALIENYEYNDRYVTINEIRFTEKALELYGKSIEELRAIRNSVVKYLSDRFDFYRERDAADCAMRVRNNMSAVTCVIDNMIFYIDSAAI